MNKLVFFVKQPSLKQTLQLLRTSFKVSSLCNSTTKWILLRRRRYIFQQDNAPCKVSKRTTDHIHSLNIALLSLPPSFLGLSPIENLASSNEMLNEAGCYRKLSCCVVHDPDLLEVCRTLIRSMSESGNAVLKAKGHHTKFYGSSFYYITLYCSFNKYSLILHSVHFCYGRFI